MTDRESAKKLIISTLKQKGDVKDHAYSQTHVVFRAIRKALKEFADEFNAELGNAVHLLEVRSRGKSATEIKIAGDLIIFNMVNNVFQLERSNHFWKSSYLQDDEFNSFVGIINIYNFLSDSFKLNRSEDLGYLIGRIFINKERHYFVEGKRQLGFLYNDFVNSVIVKEAVKNIITSAVMYCLDFDLLVPPYDNVKIVSVGQIQEKISNTQVTIGKRLGFRFYADDDNPKNMDSSEL